MPGEGQIPDQVQHLVAHKLVIKTQWAVHYTLTGENDGARFGDAANQSHVAQHLLIFLEAEGPRRSNLQPIIPGRQIDRKSLASDGCGKINMVGHTVAFAGIDTDEFISVEHFYRLQNAQVFAPAPLRLQPYLLEGLDVWQRAAIQNR